MGATEDDQQAASVPDAQEKGGTGDQPAKPFAAIIANPVKANMDALRTHVGIIAESTGWAESVWYETTAEDAGQQVTRRALADGASLILAAGGDGTIRAVAEELRGSGIPLGLIPSGTGNLLARNLPILLSDVEHAVQTAFRGTDRPIDVGVVEITRTDEHIDEHAFLVMAGLGIDAEIMANTNSRLKKTVGWLAYIDAGVRALPKAKAFRVAYRLRGRHEHTAHVSTVLIGNCGKLQGGIELMPDASIEDGELDIAVVQPKGFFGWLKVWSKVRWENGALRRSAIGRTILKGAGRFGGNNTISYLRSTGVTLTLEEARLFELDGDEMGETIRADFRTDAGALIVRMPHDA